MSKYSKTKPVTWEQRYTTASSNQAKLFKRYSNWYDALYAVVGVTPSPWRSKMYVPVLARQTWALVSKFLTLKPGFEVRLMDKDIAEEDIKDRVEKAQKKLEYDYNNPYLDESIRDKLFAPLLDAVVTGTGLAKVPWKVEKKVTYKRVPKTDGTWDLSKEAKTTRTIGYNDLEPVNIFNVFVSPAATNLYNAPWIIIKDFKPIAELKEVNKAQGVDIYNNLDKLSGSTSYDSEASMYNFSRNRLMNEQDKVDKTVDMVKIYECYEGDVICTYAENQSADSGSDTAWVLIREQKNPYWHGKYPLVKFHVKNRPYQFFGEGLFETAYRLQAGYNDVFNHFMDQWNLAENSMLMQKENTNVNPYVVEPGGVLTYRGDQPPQQFKHLPPDANAVQVLLGLMDQAIEGVTISAYATGNPNSSTDKTKGTATGIMRLQEAAGDTISFFKSNYTQSITQIGRMWLSNNQQYMDTDVNLTVNRKGKMEPLQITPADMQGDMDLIVDEASMEPLTKEQMRDNQVAYTQQLLALQAASYQQHQILGTPPLALNFTEIAEDQSEKFGVKNFQAALLPEEDLAKAQQQMQQNQTAMMQGQQSTQPPKLPSESINYKDASPYIQAQIEQQAGMQPDPAHAIQHAALLHQTDMAQQPQPEAPQQDPNQVTPDHLLQAQAQSHQQQMAEADLALRLQGQLHQQANPPQPTGASNGRNER